MHGTPRLGKTGKCIQALEEHQDSEITETVCSVLALHINPSRFDDSSVEFVNTQGP